ncbi:MAG: hypothetical protein SCARUB_00002 [Candidatus Scalindua rubra]|uniref:Lipoprotein n=1 Tax=Candidatus Scalindua rubra TaxID=1872076 RepID=A0A1E3XGK8_9BACT|nr:MAG: hypothetical protein SCARUB_00002 [Candidatus Scalindua rubra]
MSTLKILLIIPLFFLIGCSLFGSSSRYQAQDDRSAGSQSSRYTRTFNDGFEDVWSAVIMSLGDMPLDKIDKEKGIIRTDWVEGFSQRKARSIMTDRFLDDYWKERHRITINISGSNLISSVKVRCQIQEKARGGSAAYRWERKKSTGEREEEALMRIEEILTGS